MILTEEQLHTKWKPLLECDGMAPIKNSYRESVTVQLLENQEKDLQEVGPTNPSGNLGTGTNIGSWDPIMISLVRRSAPNLIAFDVAGVQPMTGPTGLIFAMKARFQTGADTNLNDDPEALFDEADTDFSGTGTQAGTDPAVLNDAAPGTYTTGTGMTTTAGEQLGSTGGGSFGEMGFTIDKISVTAKTRALKAEYTTELQQDLKAIHGLDAETELANILSAEILGEINREVIREIYRIAQFGADDTTTPKIFDLDTDSNGRWSAERFKGLLFQVDREANAIAKNTRRGRGNIILCSSDIASALRMAGRLDMAPALSTDLNVDDTGNTLVGVLDGQYKVYIDPYFVSSTNNQFMVVGYKGASPFDAGLFYAPYVPLQMVRAVGENTFQPKIGFKTRYGMVTNPFANATGTAGDLVSNVNKYYRKVKVVNLM